MYRLLIVDDEKTEREVVHFLVRDFNLDIDVRKAENGQEAISILQEWPADILCTDVQMPIMNGLEVTRKAKEILPNLKIIIFSGYAEFEYAKTAVTLGAENYILKPIVPEELENTIKSILLQIDETKNSAIYQRMQKRYHLQYAIQCIINGNINSANITTEIRNQMDSFHFMLLLHFDSNFLENYSLSLCDDIEHSISLDFESLNISPDQILLLVRNDVNNPLKLCESIHARVKYKFQKNCHIAFSQELHSYSSFADAFTDIDNQMEQRFWATGDSIFSSTQTIIQNQSLNSVDDNTQLTLIKTALAAKDATALQKHLSLLFRKYKQPVNQSQIFVKFVFSNLITTLYPYIKSTPEELKPSLDTLISDLYIQQDILEIINSVSSISKQIMDSFILNSDEMRKEISTVIEYINMHYQKNLSVEMLSSIVFLTPDYLSRLFKKSTGKSLSQYIKQVRMEKSSSLLLNTSKKVIDIGIAVGYPNYSYFCQSFREYFGSSPEKYRKEVRT